MTKLKAFHRKVHEGTELNHDRHVKIEGFPAEIRKRNIMNETQNN